VVPGLFLATQDLLDGGQKLQRRNASAAVGCRSMNTNRSSMTLSTAGFTNRADLAAHVNEKVTKLLRHVHPQTGLVRVHVKRETPHSRPPYFAVRAIVEIAGPDYFAHSEATEPAAAIDAAFDKLERSATAAARARKHWQRHARLIGVDAEVTGT
jgi:ribosome-associated translation inhibitor RaiA